MELIMNAPRDEIRRYALNGDRFGTAAVLLAITVSLCGAFVVVVESSAETPPRAKVSIATAE
jgi:hypothetical protein